MTVAQVLFVVTALVAVIAALMVVASTRLVHAPLWVGGGRGGGGGGVRFGPPRARAGRRGGPRRPARGRATARDPCAHCHSSKEGAGILSRMPLRGALFRVRSATRKRRSVMTPRPTAT